MKNVIIAICLLAPAVLLAQPGKVEVIQDEKVDTLLARYEADYLRLLENDENKGISGYRLQIFFDSGNYSGDRATEAKNDFEKKYRDIPAYITWKAPNYRVRVGDFRTRLDAEKYLKRIGRDYPNAWVIKDKINFPVLN